MTAIPATGVRSPVAGIVCVKAQGILCVSNPEKYSTEMEEGDDNW